MAALLSIQPRRSQIKPKEKKMINRSIAEIGSLNFPNSTKHLSVRCQQRGVQEDSLHWIVSYGKRERWYQGAFLYYMGKRELKSALIAEPALRKIADRLIGIAVVVCGTSGEMITTFKSKGGIRHISRSYGAQKRKKSRRCE